MSEPTKIKWRIAGEEMVNCNCSWGCPCQFNALPTTGHCEAIVVWQIGEGYFGNTRLDGTRFGRAVWWPGPIHEGNGVARTIVDEQTTKEQREALIALTTGQNGGTYWEIFASVIPNVLETIIAPISINMDRDKRRATLRIPDLIASDVEPIKSWKTSDRSKPATGEEHRARITLPDGFEYKEAEMGNTVNCRVTAGDKLTFELKNTYAQFNAFDWSN
jgi:hypothetical protein